MKAVNLEHVIFSSLFTYFVFEYELLNSFNGIITLESGDGGQFGRPIISLTLIFDGSIIEN